MRSLAYRVFVTISVIAVIVLPSSVEARDVPHSAGTSSSSMLGINLITNGDAEAGSGSTDGSVVTIPGWNTIGNVATVVQYGAAGGFPDASSLGSNNRGGNFFAGGPDINGQDASYLAQTIDVSSLQTLIDNGSLRYTLQGWFGGYATQTDWSGIRIFFLDTPTNIPGMGEAQAGPVQASERNNITGLMFRSTSGIIPPYTRYILVNLDFNRFSGVGTYNDGYADNVSLVLGSRSLLPLIER